MTYNSLPNANQQSVYAYPGGATGTYPVQANWPLQHPHQAQMVDPSIIHDAKPSMGENQATPTSQNVGRVTVSGPGMVNLKLN